MLRRILFLFLSIAILVSYQNCAEDFDVNSIGVQKKEIPSTVAPEEIEDPAYLHELLLPVSATKVDQLLQAYIDTSIDQRQIDVSWALQCPESLSLEAVEGKNCGSSLKCLDIVCTTEGLAKLQAKIIYQNEVQKELNASFSVSPPDSVELAPNIVLPSSTIKVGDIFRIHFTFPEGVSESDQQNGDIQWNLPNSNTCERLNEEDTSITLRCSQPGKLQIGVSYTAGRYYGSSTSEFSVNANIEIIMPPITVGSPSRLTLQIPEGVNLGSIQFSLSNSDCSLSEIQKTNNVSSGSLLCSRRDRNNEIQITASVDHAGIRITGHSSKVAIARGSITVRPKVPAGTFYTGDSLQLSGEFSNIAGQNFNYKWTSSSGCSFNNNQLQNPSLSCSTKGSKTFRLTVSNSNYTGSGTVSKTIKDIPSIEIANCTDSGYLNNYDKYVSYTCPNNKIMAGVKSIHSNSKEDRNFNFRCCEAKAAGTKLTYVDKIASNYINNYDALVNYSCPDERVMISSISVHSSKKEDRRFGFHCGKFEYNNMKVEKYECTWSNYVNQFDASVNFQCPAGKVIAGEASYHSNSKEDRRFKYQCCKLRIVK